MTCFLTVTSKISHKFKKKLNFEKILVQLTMSQNFNGIYLTHGILKGIFKKVPFVEFQKMSRIFEHDHKNTFLF